MVFPVIWVFPVNLGTRSTQELTLLKQPEPLPNSAQEVGSNSN